jgi:hypothetical protein
MQHSITFDTAVDAAEEVALAVAYAFGYETVEDLITATPTEEEDVDETPPATAATLSGWSRPKMRRYVSALKPTARKILRAIAENAPEVSLEDTQAAAGLEAYQYAGSMSSFGFAVRNTKGVREKPFTKVDKTYQMDTAVAQIALSALDDLGF